MTRFKVLFRLLGMPNMMFVFTFYYYPVVRFQEECSPGDGGNQIWSDDERPFLWKPGSNGKSLRQSSEAESSRRGVWLCPVHATFAGRSIIMKKIYVNFSLISNYLPNIPQIYLFIWCQWPVFYAVQYITITLVLCAHKHNLSGQLSMLLFWQVTLDSVNEFRWKKMMGELKSNLPTLHAAIVAGATSLEQEKSMYSR